MDNIFQYNTLDEVKWEISEENKIENNNQLQKAKTFFGGRYWEAWFSNDTTITRRPL